MLNKQVINASMLLKQIKSVPGTKLEAFCVQNDLSIHFMEQIGRKMVKAGLIDSRRGRGGGYSLKKQTITLADLLKVFTQTKKLNAQNELSQQVLKAISAITVIE